MLFVIGETSTRSDEARREVDTKGGRASADPRQVGYADEAMPGVRAEIPAVQRREDAAGRTAASEYYTRIIWHSGTIK